MGFFSANRKAGKLLAEPLALTFGAGSFLCAQNNGFKVVAALLFPTLHRCAELGRMHVHAGKLAFPDIPRF